MPEVLNWVQHGILFALNSSKLFNVWRRTEHSVSKWKATRNAIMQAVTTEVKVSILFFKQVYTSNLLLDRVCNRNT